MTGTGTQTDPYIVMNYEDFCNMNGGSDKYYKLGADIDFAQSDRTSTSGAIFVSFKQLDGDGHKVLNFFRRVDIADNSNSLFKFTGTGEMTFQNNYFKGIYLSGGNACFMGSVSSSYAVTLKNCRIALKINDTSSVSSQICLLDKLKLTDSEILVEGTSDFSKQITNATVYGCLIKLNLTFFNTGSTNTKTIFSNDLSFCGVTGKIICKDSNASRYVLVNANNTVSNSYFALEFDNLYSFSMTANLNGINFYDKEVMANAVSKMPVSDHFSALTTEQCKSAEYLQSIDFPCASGDSV